MLKDTDKAGRWSQKETRQQAWRHLTGRMAIVKAIVKPSKDGSYIGVVCFYQAEIG